jgi:uncharacterized protein YkwD
LRRSVLRVRRSTVGFAVVASGVLAAAGLVNALPASAASRHRHHRGHAHHARRHGPVAGRCKDADRPAWRGDDPALRAAVLCLVNKARAAHGLPLLHASARLDRSAQSWTDTMVVSGQFGHGDPGGRVSAAGFDWSSVGENIASGFPTPRAVVAGWMASQGHCENILDPAYTEVGTGVNRHPVRGFSRRAGTWTQDFGLRMGQRSPSLNWGPASGCPY